MSLIWIYSVSQSRFFLWFNDEQRTFSIRLFFGEKNKFVESPKNTMRHTAYSYNGVNSSIWTLSIDFSMESGCSWGQTSLQEIHLYLPRWIERDVLLKIRKTSEWTATLLIYFINTEWSRHMKPRAHFIVLRNKCTKLKSSFTRVVIASEFATHFSITLP